MELIKMIEKINLKIISNFYACDRLDELDSIPKLENGSTDYWKASKMLCEKDGGRLPTKKELTEIASYMYQNKIDEFNDTWNVNVKNKLLPPAYYWSSSEASSIYAYLCSFYSRYSLWNRLSNRDNSYIRALCIGD